MPDNKTRNFLGLALDLGTTVIKGCAVDLKTGRIIKQAKIYNPQNILGTNVISRISKAMQNKYSYLRELLIDGIADVKKELDITTPSFTAVIGNTVMLSFYLNKSVDGLAKFPFKSKIRKGGYTKNPKTYVFPIIGGFVGGDTIAGIFASGLFSAPPSRQGSHPYNLYLDLGTNGEVVLSKNKKIFAVSTAAGPAFEGLGISVGCLAIPGAIKKMRFRNGQLLFSTINNRKPIGICASGLIDLLAIMLKQKWLEDNGRLVRQVKFNGFNITQQDIRKIQLAIAAIHAGIKILLDNAKLKPKDINEVIVTGEFGAKLNKSSLIRLGLIPDGIKNVRFENDLPLQGAISVLLDKNKIKETEQIRKSSEHIDLALQKDFQKIFVQAMRLTTWN